MSECSEPSWQAGPAPARTVGHRGIKLHAVGDARRDAVSAWHCGRHVGPDAPLMYEARAGFGLPDAIPDR